MRGDAATEIIQFARQHEIDLIVSGSRGLSPVTSWLLGSVSRKLVHYASCSVLIVK
jgi:nucleotide-binding universal stress UspA family protein